MTIAALHEICVKILSPLFRPCQGPRETDVVTPNSCSAGRAVCVAGNSISAQDASGYLGCLTLQMSF